MPMLFARYVAGQIDDPFWDQVMQVLDVTETPPSDRMALAAFLSDAFSDLEPDAIKMPGTEEMVDLLADVAPPSAIRH